MVQYTVSFVWTCRIINEFDKVKSETTFQPEDTKKRKSQHVNMN